MNCAPTPRTSGRHNAVDISDRRGRPRVATAAWRGARGQFAGVPRDRSEGGDGRHPGRDRRVGAVLASGSAADSLWYDLIAFARDDGPQCVCRCRAPARLSRPVTPELVVPRRAVARPASTHLLGRGTKPRTDRGPREVGELGLAVRGPTRVHALRAPASALEATASDAISLTTTSGETCGRRCCWASRSSRSARCCAVRRQHGPSASGSPRSSGPAQAGAGGTRPRGPADRARRRRSAPSVGHRRDTRGVDTVAHQAGRWRARGARCVRQFGAGRDRRRWDDRGAALGASIVKWSTRRCPAACFGRPGPAGGASGDGHPAQQHGIRQVVERYLSAVRSGAP